MGSGQVISARTVVAGDTERAGAVIEEHSISPGSDAVASAVCDCHPTPYHSCFHLWISVRHGGSVAEGCAERRAPSSTNSRGLLVAAVEYSWKETVRGEVLLKVGRVRKIRGGDDRVRAG